MKRSGIDEVTIIKVLGTLLQVRHEGRNLGGRPLEDDTRRIELMAAMVEAGVNRWAAAGAATADLPESTRSATKKRIYRKYGPAK